MNNRTLLIITTAIDHQIDDRFVTSGVSPHKHATPQTTEVIMDAARSSTRILLNPRRVSRMGRYSTTSGNCNISISSPPANSPVLIGGIGSPSTRGHSGTLDIFSKRKSMSPSFIRNTQKFDASVDRKFSNDEDYTL